MAGLGILTPIGVLRYVLIRHECPQHVLAYKGYLHSCKIEINMSVTSFNADSAFTLFDVMLSLLVQLILGRLKPLSEHRILALLLHLSFLMQSL